MVKNFFASILSHIVVGFICYVSELYVYGTFMSDSGTLYEPRYTVIFCILAVAQFIGVISLYYLSGYLFIKPAKSRVKTYISVWYISFIIISIFTFISVSKVEYINNTLSFVYLICANPISYGILLGLGYLSSNIAVIGDSLVYHILYWICMAFSLLVPSGALWLGMFSSKNNREKLKKSSSKSILTQAVTDDDSPDETPPSVPAEEKL